MMKKLPVLGLMAAAVSLLAHHSTAPYDMTRATTVSGVVTKFYWANPHSFIYLEVSDAGGEVQHWELEIESLNRLRRLGWTKDTLKPGDQVSCTGARAKDAASYRMKCFSVELPNNRKLPS